MPGADPAPSTAPRIFTVSELVSGVRDWLEDSVGRIWVAGEVADLRQPGSGHVYFTLKDGEARLRAALFRGAARRLVFDPADGLEVLAYGELTVYAPRGDLQLIVRTLEPRGQGALRLAFEQLRARLEAEGLFDESVKRPLPPAPRRVGVVTSGTGAALHDVLQVTGRRNPGTPLLVAPTRVQGEGAEHEIAVALAAVGGRPDVDVILLVRGGGSLEDLQCFNREVVARAIRAAPVPVVCGVGHEVDVTIADLAADHRAPTPSAAAAAVVPDGAALRQELRAETRRLAVAGRAALAHRAAALALREARLRSLAPHARLAVQSERWNAARRALGRLGAVLLSGRLARHASLGARLLAVPRQTVERAESRLGRAAGRLDSLSPLAVLGRGYAIVHGPGDAILRRAADVEPGDALRIRLAEGTLGAEVVSRGDSEED